MLTRSHSRVDKFIDDRNCGLPHPEWKQFFGDSSWLVGCTFSRASARAWRSSRGTSELNNTSGTISAVRYHKCRLKARVAVKCPCWTDHTEEAAWTDVHHSMKHQQPYCTGTTRSGKHVWQKSNSRIFNPWWQLVIPASTVFCHPVSFMEHSRNWKQTSHYQCNQDTEVIAQWTRGNDLL